MNPLRPRVAVYLAALAAAAVVPAACKKEEPSPPPPAPSSASQPSAVSTAPATEKKAAADPEQRGSPAPEALRKSFERWDAATRAADGAALRSLYAPRLSLYGRIVTKDDAVRRKVDYVGEHPGFSQTIEDATWTERKTGGHAEWTVSFEKTSRAQGAPATTVDAFLLWRSTPEGFVIVDEGDVVTARTLAVKKDTERENWGERVFECPSCTWSGSDGVPAFAPLGPRWVTSSAQRPPGAPQRIEYGRLLLDRFASAVDVPFFLEVTETSHNGDGRWVRYAVVEQDGTERELFHCALGGHYHYESSQPGKPDPGHRGEPLITSTEEVTRTERGVHYEKTIYDARVYNFVSCDAQRDYADYFLTIAHRMGRSLRAIGGGWGADRPARVSEPYGAE